MVKRGTTLTAPLASLYVLDTTTARFSPVLEWVHGAEMLLVVVVDCHTLLVVYAPLGTVHGTGNLGPIDDALRKESHVFVHAADWMRGTRRGQDYPG